MGSIYDKSGIFPYEKAEKNNTINVLKKLQVKFPEQQITVIWDGAPYYRAKAVTEAASAMEIHLLPLPLAIAQISCLSNIWEQWLREDITYHICYDQEQELISAVANFQHLINTTPLVLSDRLWVKKNLHPEEEKLRFSK